MRNIINVKKVFNNSRNNNNNKDGLRLDSSSRRNNKNADNMMNIDTKRTGATIMSG